MNKLITSTMLLLLAGTAYSQAAATIFSPSESSLSGSNVNTVTFTMAAGERSTSAAAGGITLSLSAGSVGRWWYANGSSTWGTVFSWTNNATLDLLSTATGLSTSDISSYVVCGANNGQQQAMTYTFSGLTAGATYSIALVIYAGPSATAGTFSMTTSSGVTINSYSYGYSNSGDSITTVTEDISASSLVSSVTAVASTTANDNTLTVVVLDVTLDDSTTEISFQSTNKGGFALASISLVPEPSAFGLFAGLGALALVASRRRRSHRA